MSFGTLPTYIISHIPPCIPWVLTRCSRSGAKDCISKAVASLELQLLKTARPLGPLDRDMSDKLLQLLVKCRNRDSRDSGFSSSCSKAATQAKHSPFASFVLDLMMPVCARLSNDLIRNIMHGVTTNSESDDAVPSKCGTESDN